VCWFLRWGQGPVQRPDIRRAREYLRRLPEEARCLESASDDDLLADMLKDEGAGARAYLNAALDEHDPRVFLIACATSRKHRGV